MSFLIVSPEALAAAASELTDLGSSLGAANAAAVSQTTGLLAAGADDVSGAIAALFRAYAREYQVLAGRVAVFHEGFTRAVADGANAYAAAEAVNGAQLLSGALGAVADSVNGPVASLTGRPLFGDGATGASGPVGQPGGGGGWLFGAGGAGGASTSPGVAGGAGGSAFLFGAGGSGGAGGLGGAGGSGGRGGWLFGSGDGGVGCRGRGWLVAVDRGRGGWAGVGRWWRGGGQGGAGGVSSVAGAGGGAGGVGGAGGGGAGGGWNRRARRGWGAAPGPVPLGRLGAVVVRVGSVASALSTPSPSA
ncbi:hypothetical protein MBOU_38500 [Mycobacterium bourgelatii]|uniref:PE domain-containing protein n=1 Tax=Mycobacterium bourgelatii TaxID=1273442 RepID=A0A7I9YSZ1_MYCBU|nr:PE family protein [Mycobacterium bourgelatii]GFG91808.1 hypothetical protein MBOU_38500 [Mycobacterium bourgelatii]